MPLPLFGVDLTLGHLGGADDVLEEGIFIGRVTWGDVIFQPFFEGVGEVLKFESSKVLKLGEVR